MPPLDGLSNFALWAILAGPIVALVTALLGGYVGPADRRLLLFFLLAAVAAAIDAAALRSFDWHDAARAFVVVVGAGWAAEIAAAAGLAALGANRPATG